MSLPQRGGLAELARASFARAIGKGYDERRAEQSGMTTLTEQEVQRNMRAVAHAIGQQELEALIHENLHSLDR
jgi:hypothetical protein